MMITHITGSFNLASSAGMRFDPFFVDPVLFLGVLYCDYNQILRRSQLQMLYCSIIVMRAVLYLIFMGNMVN